MANFHFKYSLKFNSVSKLDIKEEILNLSSIKATRKGDNPAKILKNIINAYLSELTLLINNCLKKGVFPDDVKLADITPISKKEDSLNEENYGPFSILPHLSKVFEGIILYTNKLIVLWKTSFHLITMRNTRFENNRKLEKTIRQW